MIKLSELKEWQDALWKLIVDLNICINNAKRLTDPLDDTESNVLEHGFFQLHFYQLKFIAVIQLCKVISERGTQKLNILKLMNRLDNQAYDNQLKSLLTSNSKSKRNNYFKSREDIIQFTSDQRKKLEDLSDITGRTEKLRDELYAHADPSKEPLDVSFAELNKLLIFCNDFHNELNSGIFGSETLFDLTDPWSIGDIVGSVSEFRRMQEKKRKGEI